MRQMLSSDELIDEFIWYLSAERRLAENTVSSYRQDLLAWLNLLPQLGTQKAKCPPKADVLQAIEASRRHSWSKATEARRRASLRHYARFRALADESWSELLETVPATKGEDKFPKALTLEQIKEFLDFEPELCSSLESFRDKALFELMYASGLRVSEVTQLRWADVNFDEGWVRVIGKGGAERVVPTSGRAIRWVRVYCDQARGPWHDKASGPSRENVFLSKRRKPMTRMGIWKIVRRRGDASQLSEMHPHILRHSFATHLIQGGADVRVVQILLGHQSLSATERYLKISDRELFKLFTEFHPLG
jgi:integrase/recombinase XerD